jgi:hypothetical protein
MRLTDMHGDEELDAIAHSIDRLRLKKIDFPAGLMNKMKWVYQFIYDLRLETMEIGQVLSAYARLAKYTHLNTVPGAGPVDKALEELAHLLSQVEGSMNRRVPTTESFAAAKQEYQRISEAARLAAENMGEVVAHIEKELASNNGVGSYLRPLQMIKDILSVLVEALGRMAEAVDEQIIRLQPV